MSVPVKLRELPQWVVWRLEERDGKPTKVPYRADGSGRSSTTDRGTWATFEAANAAADGWDGIGFVFSPDDPYAGVDLDDCLDGTILHPEAAAIVLRLDSFTEVSPSGTGAKIIVRATKNGHKKCRTMKTPWGGEIEVYDHDRFWTITGRPLSGTPETIEDRQEQLEPMLARFLSDEVATSSSARPAVPVDVDDRELLELMFAAKNGDAIRRLWDGDLSAHGDDHSRGDLALCGHLAFWTGRDPGRIEQLFSASALGRREKWQRDDYRARTIDAAIAGCADVYAPDIPFHSLEIDAAAIENHGVPVGPVSQGSTGSPTGKPLPFERLSVMVENAPAEPDWTWRGYLAPYVLALLAGRPKVGKSTLVMALIAAAVRGESFLALEAKARGVLLLTEERRDTLAEKARILGLMDAEAPVYVLSRGDVRDTPWPEIVRQAMMFCREHNLDVLIVATLDRWTGLRGDTENAAGAVNEAMEPLLFAAAAGLAVLALSHQRKSGGEYGEAVRGSNAFVGAVDVVIELERPSRSLQLGSQARVLRSVSRFSSTPEQLFLELGEDGFLPISDVAEKQSDAERAQVLDALARHDDPVPVDALDGETELGKRGLRRRLAELREQGLAVRSGAGKKGAPYLWAALDEEDGS